MTKPHAERMLIKDNSGSAIISVVIAMLFVVALGTALLYASYMGTQVSVSSRREKETFYDASAALDEIKSGIQAEVAEALQTAYTDTLVLYGKGEVSVSNAQSTLEQAFLTELSGSTFRTKDDGSAVALISNSLVAFVPGDYSGNVITTAGGDVITIGVSAKTLAGGIWDENADNLWSEESSRLTVAGLTVTCVSAAGYESEVSTDLVVEVPKFFTGATVASELDNFAIIANKGLSCTGGTRSVTGGVYAGPSEAFGHDGDAIYTVGNNDSLVIKNGIVIACGTVSAADSSSIALGDSIHEIWAREYSVGKTGSLVLRGSIFAADDLVIGGGADVTLAGSYYGFGDSDSSSASSNADAASSSILVNGYTSGKSASLDMTGLNQLVLGGVSFIHTSKPTKDAQEHDTTASTLGGAAASDLGTGQSVMVKTDQLAYLVPAEAVTNYKTNPCLAQYDDDSIVTPIFNNKTFLWEVDGESRNLGYYLGVASNAANTVSSGSYGSIVAYKAPVYSEDEHGNDVIEYVVYFFLSFKNQAKANEYFRDYFAAKTDTISQYLDTYLTLDSNPSTMSTITKGSSYAGTTGSWRTISGTYTASQGTLSATHATYFDSQCITDYFDSYVNQALLTEAPSEFVLGGNIVAVATSGDYIYDPATQDNLRFIIAGGNVTINKPFTGIILAGGTVTVNANVTGLADASLGTASAGDTKLRDVVEGFFGGELTVEENSWSPDKLVYFDNWQKD